jgi:hypothetical protein
MSLFANTGNLQESAAAQAILDDFARPGRPKTAIFPVNFPVSRELNAETGSIATASATTHSMISHGPETTAERGGIRRVFVR